MSRKTRVLEASISVAVQAIKDGEIEMFNRLYEPASSDFRDGYDAEGWWINDHDDHVFNQIAGSSGIYLIEYTSDGELIRDGRPWQMTA